MTVDLCRSFISIIFPDDIRLMASSPELVSILYKYHISHIFYNPFTDKVYLCRSFISIIFPFNKGRNTELRIVSILYKYHISQKAFDKKEENVTVVSILYKYHISQKAFDKKEENVTVVSILYKYHISLQNTTMKKQPSSSCRSFISIIFPLLNIAHFGL